MPLAVINQLLIYDEIASGNKPRWAEHGDQAEHDLEALLSGALTATS